MNTAIVEQQITCPKCSTPVDWPLRWAVNVAEEPDLKERVLTWKIHLFVCPMCMTEVDLMSDFTYYDTKEGFIVMLWSADDWNPQAMDAPLAQMSEQDRTAHLALTTRRVRTRTELVEKVNIFDANLDDRIVELLKFMLQAEQPQLKGLELRFSSIRDGQLRFAILKEDGPAALDLPMGAYEQYVSAVKPFNLPAKNAERWAEIDFEFARKLMEQAQAGMPLP